MDVKASVQAINQTISQYSFGSQPEELYRPMHYMLELDQTRLCPLLTFWGCYLFSGDTTKALMPGIGVEVFYNFLMVHEDILDRNPYRKGSDSVYVKWNDNVAILSGDAMIFKAYELMMQVDQQLIKPVIRLFNQCFTSVCEGKQLSLNQPDDLRNSDDYLKMLKLKSGALTEFSFQLGALIGGATEEQGEQAGLLGNDLGVKWVLPANKDPQSLNPSILQSLSKDHQSLNPSIPQSLSKDPQSLNPSILQSLSKDPQSLNPSIPQSLSKDNQSLNPSIPQSLSLNPSIPQSLSLNPSILQSLSNLDCNEERKQEFELWVKSSV